MNMNNNNINNDNIRKDRNEPIDIEAIEIMINEEAATFRQEQSYKESPTPQPSSKKRSTNPLIAGLIGALIGSSTMLGGVYYFHQQQDNVSQPVAQSTANTSSNKSINVTN